MSCLCTILSSHSFDVILTFRNVSLWWRMMFCMSTNIFVYYLILVFKINTRKISMFLIMSCNFFFFVAMITYRTTARAPVVGWPPIRSCRKNLGSNSFSKTQLVRNYDDKSEKEVLKDHQGKTDQGKSELDHLFVKINMEGVPIGRKVDLKSFDSYEKLSYAIDALFRGLLAGNLTYKLKTVR